MANGHGGSRPGSGRKPNAEKYADQLGKANDHLAYELRECAKALLDLALGNTEEVERVPAGTLWRKDVIRVEKADLTFLTEEEAGKLELSEIDGILLDQKGKPAIVDVPMYPDLDPTQLVEVKRKKLRPDVRALAYIWDRLEGRANYVPPVEPEGVDIRAALREARELASSYVDPDAIATGEGGGPPENPENAA
jgi:hypothetical protein